MDFTWMKNDKLVEAIINYGLILACGDKQEHMEENFKDLKAEAKKRGLDFKLRLKKEIENKELLEKIYDGVYKSFFAGIEEWEFAPANHFKGFIFGKAPITFDDDSDYFHIKYENHFLFLWDSQKKHEQVLLYAEELFKKISNEENYFVFDHKAGPSAKTKEVPLKAVGEKAKMLLEFLQSLPKKEFMFNYNQGGILNIIRKSDNTIFRCTPHFEEQPYFTFHCFTNNEINDIVVGEKQKMTLLHS